LLFVGREGHQRPQHARKQREVRPGLDPYDRAGNLDGDPRNDDRACVLEALVACAAIMR
jgi:hypothetical protein